MSKPLAAFPWIITGIFCAPFFTSWATRTLWIYFKVLLSHRVHSSHSVLLVWHSRLIKLKHAFPKGCCTEVNYNCCFSAETDGVQPKSFTHLNGSGVDNQAFEIEVCHISFFKENGATWSFLFINKMTLFSQEDNITDTSSVKRQTKKNKKGLGSYLRCVTSSYFVKQTK